MKSFCSFLPASELTLLSTLPMPDTTLVLSRV